MICTFVGLILVDVATWNSWEVFLFGVIIPKVANVSQELPSSQQIDMVNQRINDIWSYLENNYENDISLFIDVVF